MTTLLAEPRGKGYVRAANELRVDVPAHQWADTPGTDYWLIAGSADLQLASALAVTPNVSGLDSYGWTVSTLSAFSNAVTADFMSSTDDTPPNFNGSAASDTLTSPAIFGNYSHALQAGQYLGFLPTRLVGDIYGAFPTVANNDNSVYMGLMRNETETGTCGVAVFSDGTVWNLQISGLTPVQTGITPVDTNYHVFRFMLDRRTGNLEWFVDKVLQGTWPYEADIWPVGLWAESGGAAANRWAISWAHIFYE